MSKKSVFLTCILFLLIGLPSWAQSNLFGGSGTQFVLFTGDSVVGVSKKKEAIKTAPGIVSVISAEDIKNSGAQTVADAISFATGVFQYDTYFNEFSQFAIRGNIGGEHYNSKILFLVNGHPSYSPVHGGFEVNGIPLNAIKAIEIIRGPSSVLYGTNALTGVINIITHAAQGDETMVEASYQFGSWDTHEARASLSKKWENFGYFFSTTIKDQEGYDLDIDADQDEGPLAWSHDHYNNLAAFFLGLEMGDFQLDLSYYDSERTSKHGVLPNFAFRNTQFEDQNFFADFRYRKELSEDTSINFNIRYDKFEFEYVFTNINVLETLILGRNISVKDSPIGGDSEKVGVEFFVDSNLTDTFNIVAGVLYDDYEAGPYQTQSLTSTPSFLNPFNEDTSNSDFAVYANFNWNVKENTNIVGGARYTDNDISGTHTDYRAGLVFGFSENWTAKVLYGTSYRAPNIFELFTTSAPVIVGDLDNDFETLEGFDFGVYYEKEGSPVRFSATYFFDEIDDFITRRTSASLGSPVYLNVEGTKTSGIEADLKLRPTENVSLFINGTFIVDSEDKETGDELDYIIETYFNFGATYQATEKLRFVNANSYRGDWNEADAYFISNLAAYYTLDTDSDTQWELFIVGNNIFDEDYDYSEPVRRNVDTIPGGAPVFVTGGVKAKF